MNIPLLFLFTCSCVHIQVTATTFLLLFCKTTLCTHFLHNNILEAILVAEKRGAINAATKIGAQLGLVGESGPGSVQRRRVERKLSNVPRVFQKTTNLCAMMERNSRPRDETAHAPVPPEMRAAISAVCRKNCCKTSICRMRCLPPPTWCLEKYVTT